MTKSSICFFCTELGFAGMRGSMAGFRRKEDEIWASPEKPMKAFLFKTTTDSLKDLPRKVAMVCAKGTLDFAKDVS